MGAQPLRPVTETEISDFHRDGAVLLKGVLGAQWLELAEQGLDAAIATPDVMTTQLAEGSLRVDQFPAAKSPELRRFIDESPIAAIVGQALASPVSFYMDQLFHKPAGLIPATQWHQDTCYYNLDGHDLIRAWVSPDAVPRNVSVEVVRGSHRWNVTYAPVAGRKATRDEDVRQQEAAASNKPALGADAYENWSYASGMRDQSLPPVPAIEAAKDSFEIMGWDYEPGDVLLFHGHILHGALGDVVTTSPRRSHASLWAGTDVYYRHRPGQIIPDPIALYDHSPVSGQLISEFPDVFPIAWSPSNCSG